ncbi:uncharacterized protein LOC120423214 [Culex pipiens pallens]|uniref:uncharacterized protein LOC120423214 n=1 Tax=Culex pipiens pallens TaxID=42434 RepID=UPI0019544707|nr:uncharacterized protein LOC120423214 [Culex pipiens pallens]
MVKNWTNWIAVIKIPDPKKPKTEEGEGIRQVPMRKIIVVVQRMGEYVPSVPSGSHGLLEHTLTIDHCTGDKWYMFRFFEKKTPRPRTRWPKRRLPPVVRMTFTTKSLDDDEFDLYLDRRYE